jgi:hypothetical protein
MLRHSVTPLLTLLALSFLNLLLSFIHHHKIIHFITKNREINMGHFAGNFPSVGQVVASVTIGPIVGLMEGISSACRSPEPTTRAIEQYDAYERKLQKRKAEEDGTKFVLFVTAEVFCSALLASASAKVRAHGIKNNEPNAFLSVCLFMLMLHMASRYFFGQITR